jgi:hypothetical protein
MSDTVRLIGGYFNQFCALLIIVSMVGAWRLVRAVASSRQAALWSQAFLLAWLAMLIVATYVVPPMGMWAVGLVVPLFSDNHLYAWLAETVGAESVFRTTRDALRKAGPFRYVAMASTQHLLHGGLGLVILTVSAGRNSWEYWLGYGVVASAGMGILAHALIARRFRDDWWMGARGEAA